MAHKENIYVIQKFVSANSLSQALKREHKAKIVSITLTIATPEQQQLESVGFRLYPDGKENIKYD